MKRMVWVVFFFPLVLWGESRFSLGANGSVMMWPYIVMFNTSQGWRQVSGGSFLQPVYSLQGEFLLDDTWTMFGRVGLTPFYGSIFYFGELTFRWYGNTYAPEGVSVGGGILYGQIDHYVGFYPKLFVAYKWLLGKHWYIEPEIFLFLAHINGALGVNFSLGVGYRF